MNTSTLPPLSVSQLDAFSFENVPLGAPLFLSQAMRAIHRVRGVAAVDVDVFDILTEAQLLTDKVENLASVLNEAKPRISLRRNQIAYLVPDVPETLILQEVII